MSLEQYWDDYEVGHVFQTSGRTITDADIRLFIGATDAINPAHTDVEFAKTHPFGKPVAQGTLTIGVVDGLVVKDLVPGRLKIAHYGYDKIRFLRPVFPGDTVSMRATVVEKRPREDGFGIVVFDYDVMNQRGEIVAAIRDLQMIERRSAGGRE
jgi:acyl dehydratase